MSLTPQPEQKQPAAETAESQNLITADGVPIAQLQCPQTVYVKVSDDYDGVFQEYEMTEILDNDRYALKNPASNFEISYSPLRKIFAKRPSTGRILRTQDDHAQYERLQSMKKGDALTDVSAETRESIQVLLELNFLNINPAQLFESLTAEFPHTTQAAEELQPGQSVFVYNSVGTYVTGTILKTSSDEEPRRTCPQVTLFDNSVKDLPPQFICSQLPDGKRACRTQKQLNAFTMYAAIADSDGFIAQDPEQQRLIHAGLAKAFLEA